MGILPLQFEEHECSETLELSGKETYSITGLAERFQDGSPTGGLVQVTATDEGGSTKTFNAVVRIDTPGEAEYFRHGGILQYVLRRLAAE